MALVYSQNELLQTHLEYDWKLKSLEKAILKLQNSPWFLLCFKNTVFYFSASLSTWCRASNNDKVTNTAPWEQLYLDHPKGFEHRCQVMSDKSLYFSCYYFEVDISGTGVLGMTYRSIYQTSAESNSCTSGNNFSWSILQNGKGFSAWHSDGEMPLKWMFGRTGVYPNYPSRTLSFYGVTYDDVTLMHQLEYDFAESLYHDFWLLKKENCQDNMTAGRC
ncbi:LOW QUALITY PROTEIN: tripartite motif-containing protein 16 [Pluvialis apricaria]